MAQVSPPKPWERGSTSGGALSSVPSTSSASTPSNVASSTIPSSTSTSRPPAIPTRPTSLNSVVNQTASNYSPYGANRLGTSPFGVGGYNSYSSPYSRFGGMNSMYGGYGSGYGNMYGGMGGMGGMYGGMGQPGMMGMDPNDPNSLTNSFSQNTQATFQMIESIVGAFGGFAQMLENTYMATHSSFFAMISVAEQFSNLRNTLGSILGIFTLLRWTRTIFAKITGRPPPADATSLTPSAFASFQGLTSSSSSSNQNPNAPPTPSKKPFLVFILAVFGLPYLMSKLIRSLASQQEQQSQNNRLIPSPNNPAAIKQPIDASSLTFCRLLYDYTPPNAPHAVEGIDLTVKKGDLVAVLSKLDPVSGEQGQWWRCRTRDGKIGFLPGVYMGEIVPAAAKKVGAAQKAIEEGRAKTMSDSSSRANSLVEGKAQAQGEKGRWGVEEFQKGGEDS
ncbi:MAG: hypothetical protein L6R37_002487 [Teloschistes peruensis]|nr:MAG: hypothetical protein L6R37_002487 [Teloschistes peruensis]